MLIAFKSLEYLGLAFLETHNLIYISVLSPSKGGCWQSVSYLLGPHIILTLYSRMVQIPFRFLFFTCPVTFIHTLEYVMCTSIQRANCRMRQGIHRQVTKQIDYRKLSKVLHLSHFEKGENMKIHLKTFHLDTVPVANMIYIKKLKQKEDKLSESLPSLAILPKKSEF